MENGEEKKENCKREGGKLKMTKICFGATKMEIFYWEKVFHVGKKIRKNDFAPSENFSCLICPCPPPPKDLGKL